MLRVGVSGIVDGVWVCGGSVLIERRVLLLRDSCVWLVWSWGWLGGLDLGPKKVYCERLIMSVMLLFELRMRRGLPGFGRIRVECGTFGCLAFWGHELGALFVGRLGWMLEVSLAKSAARIGGCVLWGVGGSCW